jgi:anti-sigma B factor antagonist
MKGIDVIVEQAGSHYQIAVVRVLGQIDTTTSHELERRLQYLLKDHQFEIVIDLSRVTYISSAGWGIFISEIRGIRENGGDLKLVGMTPEVAEVFELLEFHNILESFKTVEAAVEKFEQPKAAPAASEKHASDKVADSASPASERQKSYESNEEVGPVAYGAAPPSQRQKSEEPSKDTAAVPVGTTPAPQSNASAVQGDASVPANVIGATTQTGAFPMSSRDSREGEPGTVREGTRQTTRESVRAAREAQMEATSRVDSEYAASSRHKTEATSPGAPRTIVEPEQSPTMPMSKDLEAMILEIVREHPDYGCLKIRKELLEHDYRRPMNPLTLFMELKRLNLETKEKRKRYADSFVVVGSKK